ncbi:MAG: hypothetical protein WA175_06085 [Candidatus Acidiferrales bacterium]
MSMETKDRRSAHPEPDREAGYERRDANIRGLLEFAFWLAMVLVVTLLAMKLTYHFFAKMEPVGPPASPFTNVREIPAGPLLQAAPHLDLQTYCEGQEQQVNTYGWIDQQQGTVRLPVDRAMDLLLERGLPTRAPSETPPGSSAEVEAPFLPATEDAQGQCSFVEDQRMSEAPIE